MSATETAPRWGASTPQEEVVVIGMGAFAPGAADVSTLWENALNGVVSLSPLEPAEDFPYTNVEIAGQTKDFDPEAALEKVIPNAVKRKGIIGRNERATFFGLIAVHEALSQAGLINDEGKLDAARVDPDLVATIIGTGIGGAGYLIAANKEQEGTSQHKAPLYTALKVLPER